MNSPVRKYLILNIIFSLIILFIIIYSFIYSGSSHPVPALLSDITGIIPPSKGLSSSFSEIVRGNLYEARLYNPYGIQIFLFFLIQLLLRALTSMAIKMNWVQVSIVLIIDIVVSVFLFIISFAPLIKYTLKLFVQLF